MGRAQNSFTGWVGGTTEIDEDKVTLPEKDLWVAVLCRAILDACKGPPCLDMTSRANIPHKNLYGYNRRAARHFFLEGGKHFRHVCEMAGRNPTYVQTKIRKIILRKNGWNMDVPITSPYRRSEASTKRKRGRPKKHLTGNSYYAAIRKKGGRPRIYNVV
jgi:hypothetical protein